MYDFCKIFSFSKQIICLNKYLYLLSKNLILLKKTFTPQEKFIL